MRGLEFDSESWEQENEVNEQQEQQEETQEAMGYSSDHYQRARDYYLRSRNGHKEALAGVTFEEVLGRRNPNNPADILPRDRMPIVANTKPVEEGAEEPIEKPEEAPMGNILREALEKQKAEGSGEIPEKQMLQVSKPYPRYNVSFRGGETAEHPEGKEAMGKSSDHWQNRMEEALSNNDMTTYRVAKNNYLEAIAQEQAEAIKG